MIFCQYKDGREKVRYELKNGARRRLSPQENDYLDIFYANRMWDFDWYNTEAYEHYTAAEIAWEYLS
jgi:hypothetical protein